MTRDDLKLRRMSAQLEGVSPLAAVMVRQVEAHESAVREAAKKLAELSAGVPPDVWIEALGVELWAQVELRRETDVDGVFVAEGGQVWVRPKGGG